MHKKTALRKGITQRLIDAVPALTTVCGAARLDETVQSDEFPFASISISEKVQPIGGNFDANKPLKRNFDIAIVLGHRCDLLDSEELLEAIQVEVEQALLKSTDINVPGVVDWAFKGTGPFNAVSEANVVLLPLNFSCSITTRPGDPTQSI